MTGNSGAEIKNAVVKGYIEGIHEKQDKGTILKGFHEDFEMLVLSNDQLEKVNIDTWLQRLKVMKKQNPALWESPTSYELNILDNTSYTASIKIDVFKGKIHFSTDYMLIYKIKDEWRIVSKIYSVSQ